MAISYPIKFKAAILDKHNSPLVLDEIEFKGPLEVGQVFVRIYYSGICGKQIEEIKGVKPDPFLPHLLGHEGSGVVLDIGPGVKKVSVGDNVVLHWLKGSGIDALTPNYLRKGKKVNAGWVTTFNEYGVISENRITPISKNANLEVACLLGCAVTTGVGVIFNEAKLRPNDSVTIFGCGGIGLNAVQAASLLLGYPIIAVDSNPEALELAKKLGATHTLQVGLCDVIKGIKNFTDGKGTQYVIMASGNPQAAEMAVRASSMPGTVYFVGVPPVGSKITIEPFDVHMLRKLVGSCGGNTFPDKDIPSYLSLYERGHLKLKELISAVVPLDKINDGIKLTLSGKIGRCIIKMSI